MKFSGKRLGWIAGCAVAGALGGRLYYANLDAPVMSAERIAPMPNAYDTYVQAFPKLTTTINGSSANVKGAANLPPLTERQAALAQDAEGMERARLALTQKFLAPVPDFTTGNHTLAKFRSLARLYADEGEIRFETGDKSGAMNSYLDAMTMGAQIPQGGPLIDRLVGIACQAIGRKQIWDRIDSWDAESLKAGARRMEKILAAEVPMAYTFGAEKMGAQLQIPKLLNDPAQVWRLTHPNEVAELFLDAVQPNAARDEDEDVRPRKPSAWEMRINQQMFLFRYPKRSALNGYNAYLDALIQGADRPYAQRGPLPKMPQDYIAALIVPVFDQAEFKNHTQRTQNALLTLTLALRAYKSEHGIYPANLDDLVSENYLTQIPADPFSPDGKAPLRIKFNGQGFFSGEKSIAYSVGPDGADDGGQEIINFRDENGGQIPPGSFNQYRVLTTSKGDILAGENLN